MMELPNYFLADLPDGSSLSPSLIQEACRTLKKNRERFLLSRPSESIITTLAGLARDWLDPEFPFRKIALAQGPRQTGFSAETLAAGLDRFFSRITRANLEALLVQDLGSVRRLDELISDSNEARQGRVSLARGPELLVHITGGVLPDPSLMSIMLGLLARAAQFVKCATGTGFIPRMFAHSLYAIQPKLGACLEIAEWKGGSEPLESALFAEADCVTAAGSDETLDRIQSRLSARTRFLPHGHKLSFGYVARESLVKLGLEKVVSAAALDVTAWNQLGCLSPHVIYVETGGALAPHRFAELLAARLETREIEEPRGSVSAEISAGIATRRMFYQVRASAAETTRLWSSPGSTAWTVIFEEDPDFQVSCLNRFIYVKPITDLPHLFRALASIQGKVSTVGLSAPPHRVQEIATTLARWGVPRVCPLGRMQDPPLTWRHDGRPSLGDLITWTELEM